MRFDFASFLIGLIIGCAISAVLYLQRETVARWWQSFRAWLRRVRDSITARIASRYQAALRLHLDQLNVAHPQADFDALYIDRFFDQPPARPTLNPIDPASLTPIALSAAVRSSTRLVILGESGSGRTTLLIKLTRVLLDQQAQTQLGLSQEYAPVCVHLGEIDWSRVTKADPLSPLADAAAAHMPALIASNVNGFLKSRVRSNSAAVLLDGLDELSPSLRSHAHEWLINLVKQFPDNQYVITTGLNAYGVLNQIGFAALKLADWTANDVEQLAQRWIKVVSGGDQDFKVLRESLHQIDAAIPQPIDLTIAALVWKEHAAAPKDRSAALEQWIDRVLQTLPTKDRVAPDKIKSALGTIAWTTYQENRIQVHASEIEQAILDTFALTSTQDRTALAGLITEIAHDTANSSSLFIPFAADAWAFTHRHIAAYLAAWHAVQTHATLDSYWLQPEWSEVFNFYAALNDPIDQIDRSLSTPDDLSRSNLWTAAQWTGAASVDAPWRSKVMGELARSFLQPDQVSVLRDRTLNALLITRDKSLGYLLKRGLAHPDGSIRARSLTGLARLNRVTDLPTFTAAIKNTDIGMRTAAVLAIGSMAHTGSDEAVKTLISILLEQDEDSRRLAAEQLAQCGAEGQQILREASGEEDIKVRRAAVYGLAATHESWAREFLMKMEHEDAQWFVRSAATDGMKIMDTQAKPATEATPPDFAPIVIDQQGWLVEWAAQQGIGIGVGKMATQALMRALDEGSIPVRLAAIQTLLHIGDLSHHDKLRTLLLDPDRSIREAAFNALETIGARTGQVIPR